MADSLKPAIIAGLVLSIIFLISPVFAAPLDLIVVLVTPFLCGLLAVCLYGKKSSSKLRLRDGAKLGFMTGGVAGLILIVIGALLLYTILPAVAWVKPKNN